MPNIKSASKRVLTTKNRSTRNRADRSGLRTTLKKFETAVTEGNREAAESAYTVAIKAVDKAASGGLIHKNNAAHKKSALTIKLNRMA
jgi:small subunit ribosomal protein S20